MIKNEKNRGVPDWVEEASPNISTINDSQHQAYYPSEEARNSHITVRKILYLNKVDRMAKNQECIIRYVDIARCRDIDRASLDTVCDPVLYSTENGYAHQGHILDVVSKVQYKPFGRAIRSTEVKEEPTSRPRICDSEMHPDGREVGVGGLLFNPQC